MKYWIHTLVILIVGFILQLVIPWWILVFVAAISAFIINQKVWLMVLFGFLGGLILWGGVSLYIDIENNQILSERMGALFGGLSPNLLIILTSVIGGLTAGVASYFGISLRKVFSKS